MRAALLLVLAALATPSLAAWVRVSESKTLTYYYDLSTLKKEGDIRRIGELIDLKEKRPTGSLSGRLQTEYDCSGKRVRVLSFSSHAEGMGNGKVLETDSSPADWKPIAPGTIHADILKHVCVDVPTSASAVWEKLGENAGTTYYVDSKSVTKSEGVRRVWQVANTPAKGPNGESSVRMLKEYHCKEERSRVILLVSFTKPMAEGEMVDIYPDPYEWKAIPAGSADMAYLRYACSR